MLQAVTAIVVCLQTEVRKLLLFMSPEQAGETEAKLDEKIEKVRAVVVALLHICTLLVSTCAVVKRNGLRSQRTSELRCESLDSQAVFLVRAHSCFSVLRNS